MTSDEFNRWLVIHENCFPGVRAWLASMRPPDSRGVLVAWWKVLKRFSFAVAEEASQELWQSGGGAYGDHPILMRKLIHEKRAVTEESVDTGPSLLDATPEEKATCRSILEECKAAMVKPAFRVPEPRIHPIEPEGSIRPPRQSRNPETLEELREYAKTTAMPMRIETVAQYCDRMAHSKKKR